MRRREFITLIGGAGTWPLGVRAQQTQSMLRVGSVSLQPSSAPFNVAFQQRMAELGYQEAKNFAFDFVKVANGGAYETAYAELVARHVDILVAGGPEIALQSAIAASQAIPIVMIAIDYDPFARGYVTSLAQPGGRITGLFLRQIELTEKRLQFFKDAFPDMEGAMAFWDRISADQWEAAQPAAARLGVRLAGVDLGTPPFDYERALAQAPLEHRKYLFMLNSPLFFADRMRQAEFASRNRIASMFAFRQWAEAGGLISYGPSLTGMYRRGAEIVDRIARGTKPRDLPIEQPTTFELVINLATARKLGLNISSSLLARADEVIG
jgi:putative tryptophan/tyrosine transport system substrate-binding protein